MEPLILFSNISKTYDESGVEALKDVNFYVDKGEFVFLIGSSGAGKSTITSLIMREQFPTRGSIYINNVNITEIPEKELPYYRRKLGIVFQDFRLLPNKTVHENVAFALRVVGASRREIKAKVPAVLDLVGLSDKVDANVGELSGGQIQRVAIARAIINNPPVLLCDEPTGNLDPATAVDIMNILTAINKNGTTILVVTHAQEIVNGMKKRVIALENGVVVRDEKEGVYSA